MFQRILVPTDGSDLSKKAVRAAIRLAAGTGAHLVAFHAIPKFRMFTLDAQMLEDTAGEYRVASVARARTLLAGVAAEARKAGLQGVLLGSETQKVLTHSTIPVLVYR